MISSLSLSIVFFITILTLSWLNLCHRILTLFCRNIGVLHTKATRSFPFSALKWSNYLIAFMFTHQKILSENIIFNKQRKCLLSLTLQIIFTIFFMATKGIISINVQMKLRTHYLHKWRNYGGSSGGNCSPSPTKNFLYNTLFSIFCT